MVGGIVSEIYIAFVVRESADTTPVKAMVIMINAMSRLMVLDLVKKFDGIIGNKLATHVIN
jgi:hypothetical protein